MIDAEQTRSYLEARRRFAALIVELLDEGYLMGGITSAMGFQIALVIDSLPQNSALGDPVDAFVEGLRGEIRELQRQRTH